MNRIFLILFTILTVFSVKGKNAIDKFLVPDIPIMNEWINVNFIHIDFNGIDLKVGDKIVPGSLMGQISNYPDTLSLKYDSEIHQSIDYYSQREFVKASNVLKPALEFEPDNYFVLNYYARACYWTDRDESFRVYQILINKLDSTYKTSDNKVIVDLWFREAYWKLGTLYMDHNQYDKAYREISRSQASIQDMKGTTAYSQGLQYLTECAYEMFQDDLANYLAQRTLIYDRKNEYAKDVIKKIKKQGKKN
jgi:tetratricopeptide (TPR) repeat protein